MTDREIIQKAYEQEAMELFSACVTDYNAKTGSNALSRFEKGVRLLQRFRDQCLAAMPKDKKVEP